MEHSILTQYFYTFLYGEGTIVNDSHPHNVAGFGVKKGSFRHAFFLQNLTCGVILELQKCLIYRTFIAAII